MVEKLAQHVGPYFGEYGGRFVPESLIAALDELDSTYQEAKSVTRSHLEASL